MVKEEFKDIAPYPDSLFKEKMAVLAEQPGLENAIRFAMPQADYAQVKALLTRLGSTKEFQESVMFEVLKALETRTTDGVSVSGFEHLAEDSRYTFISNHRDIVLDASFLGLCMLRHGMSPQEVALGDNLLIYDWIEDLVRLNKGIIVKRNLRLTKALEAAKQLSAYIHYCICEKHESVWIAQREGRAKDSNDVTQESVIKMLGLSGEGNLAQNLLSINILPTSISYEYDPNDYLKAREFLARRRDPEFKKSQRDDLFSMETGILGYKGRVHFSLGECINSQIEPLTQLTDKNEMARNICAIIDRSIHLGYMIYPINYIAFDFVNNSHTFESHYSDDDVKAFNEYIAKQLEKVDLPDITDEERDFMRRQMMMMYANPLMNQLVAKGEYDLDKTAFLL